MPLRILRLRGLVSASLVRGFLVTGMYSTFFLGTPVPRARPPLQRRCRPARPSCPGRSRSRSSRAASPRGSSPVRAAPGARRGHGERGDRPAAVQHRRTEHRLLPDDLRRLLRDRPRHRQRVHAAAHDRDGRRARRRRRASARDHQRLPADQRRARARRAQHDRRQPDEGAALRPPGAHELADQRLPPRLPRRRRQRSPPASSSPSCSCDRAPCSPGCNWPTPRRRITPLESTSTSREKPHDTSNRLPAHTSAPSRAGRRSSHATLRPAAAPSCA